MTLHNKTYVLTGASGGLGNALAHTLAARGSRLLLVGRNQQALLQLLQSLPNSNRHRICVADLSQDDGIKHVTQSIDEFNLTIDGLINNAGVSEFSLLDAQSDEKIQTLIATNLIAPIRLTKALLPYIKEQDQGHIVNIGSSFGSLGYPGFTSYCASKFGLRGFTEALRRELSYSPIAVSYIAPRAIHTRINSKAVCAMNAALGNAMDQPEVIAKIIARLLEKRAGKDSFIGWPEKFYIRLNALLPTAIDKSIRKQLPVITQFSTQ